MSAQLRIVLLSMFSLLVFVAIACSENGANGDVTENEADTNNVEDDNSNNSGGEIKNENNDTDQNNDAVPEADRDPVTLIWSQGDGEEYFDNLFREAVEEQFPYITIEYVQAEDWQLEELIAQGTVPDIITINDQASLSRLHNQGLTFDLNPFIEQYNVDLSRIEPNIIESIQNRAENGETYMLPFRTAGYAMYYNKDIFDMFGETYLTDDMTWDEVIDIGARLTRTEDGVDYIGLDMEIPEPAFNQLGTPHVDPHTDEPLFNSEAAFQQYYGMLEQVYSIPGMYDVDDPSEMIYTAWGGRFAEGVVGMLPLWNLVTWWDWAEGDTGLNWDMVTYPLWESDGYAPLALSNSLSISPVSEHAEVAFEVIMYVLSDEFQARMSRDAGTTVLVDETVRSEFAADHEGLADKNLDAFFKHEPHPGPEQFSRWEGAARDLAWDSIDWFVHLDQDVNSFLREMQEMAEEAVREERSMFE